MRRSVLLAGLLALAGPATAGPWAQGRGHVYAKLGYGHLDSKTLATPDGTKLDIPDFRKDEVGLFGALGLTRRLDVLVSVPLFLSSDLEDFGRESGFGDVKAGLAFQVAQRGPWVVGVRGLVQAPTGDETKAEGLLPTGSGVWEGEGVLGVGRSLAKGKAWAFAEVGHQIRGGDLRDSFLFGGQVGWHAGSRISLAAQAHGVIPWDSSARAVAIGSPTGLSDRVGYVAYGPTAFIQVGGPWSLQLDVEDTFRERNLATGVTFRAGIAFQR